MKHHYRQPKARLNAQNQGFADVPGLGPHGSKCEECSFFLNYYSFFTSARAENSVCLKRLEHRGEGERVVLEQKKNIRAVIAIRAAAPSIERTAASCCEFKRLKK